MKRSVQASESGSVKRIKSSIIPISVAHTTIIDVAGSPSNLIEVQKVLKYINCRLEIRFYCAVYIIET